MKGIGSQGVPIEVLLVEDSPGDVRLTQEAFREANPSIHLHVATDGVEALAFLRREGEHADAPRPRLVLLDLNLPKLDGREVLQAIRGNDVTRTLPVVVLTTSTEPFDVEASYALGVNSYIQKPVDFARFVAAMRQLGLYWLVLNQGPPG